MMQGGSDRRHRVQHHGSRGLLRDGERRLRLHLDRDAARCERLVIGCQDVGHVSNASRSRHASRIPTKRKSSMPLTRARWSSCFDRGHGRSCHGCAQLDGFLPFAAAATAEAWRSARTCGRARRLPPDNQRQHRARPHDRDAEGLKNADEIAKIPASPRSSRPAATWHSGFRSPDYERYQHRARRNRQGRSAVLAGLARSP